MSAREPAIGLEVHVRLATRSKLFSPVESGFSDVPNRNVGPICGGHPGTLPVLNRAAVELALRACVAVDAQVQPVSRFDRKHYFYPDLPKGYQLTQHVEPLAVGGSIPLVHGNDVVLRRIHLEEDAGRLMHDYDAGRSFVDLNRAGAPLIELVTEPDLNSGAEAAAAFRWLHRTLVWIGVTDGRMSEGAMRCDANVSLRTPKGELGTRVEIKNVSSFKFLERAIDDEVRRQRAVISSGDHVRTHTRQWDEASGRTRRMREKETLEDYRFMRDPDLPALRIRAADVSRAKESIGETRSAAAERLQGLGLPSPHVHSIADTRARLRHFDATLELDPTLEPSAVSSLLCGPILERENLGILRLGPDGWSGGARGIGVNDLADLCGLIDRRSITSDAVSVVVGAVLESGATPSEVVEARGLRRTADVDRIREWVDAALRAMPNEAARLRAGNPRLAGPLVGWVMRRSGGTADPRIVKRLVEAHIGGVE